MNYFFSASDIAFYVEAVHGERMVEVAVTDEAGNVIGTTMQPNPSCTIPEDAVPVSAERHAELFAAQAAGMVISADSNGLPIAQPAPPPTAEQLRAIAVVDIDRRREEGLVAGVVMGGEQFHCDDRFLVELLGMIMGYQAGIYSGTQSIRTRDNQIVQLDVAGITALAATVGEHRKAVYAASWAEKDAL